MRYAFIAAHSDHWPITVQCRVLRVTTSGYYAWKRRPGSKRPDEDDRLSVAIRSVFKAHRGAYGAPRITKEVRSMGHRVNHKRVERLMREMGLCARQRRQFKPQTTVADPEGPVFPDLLKQDFSATVPNQRWVGDITYLRCADGFEYLATVLDLYSRRVVGWAMGREIDARLVIKALNMAVDQRQPPSGVIFHSDRGCQYTSVAFRLACQQAGVRQSMGRTGCCYDNAAAESFFHSLKVEWIHGHEIMERQAMRTLVFQYIEGYYNSNRRHSTLDYLSPCSYEEIYPAGRHHAPPRSAAQRAPEKKPGDTSNAGTPRQCRETAVRPPTGRLVPAPPGCLLPAGTRPLYQQDPNHPEKS